MLFLDAYRICMNAEIQESFLVWYGDSKVYSSTVIVKSAACCILTLLPQSYVSTPNIYDL